MEIEVERKKGKSLHEEKNWTRKWKRSGRHTRSNFAIQKEKTILFNPKQNTLILSILSNKP